MAEMSGADFLKQFAYNQAGRGQLLSSVILPFEKPLIELRLVDLGERENDLVAERVHTPLSALGPNDLNLQTVRRDRARIEGLLRRSVVDYPEPTEERATLGSLISITDGDKESTLAVVGFGALHKTLIEGVSPVSIEAPLVSQLIGYRVGQVVAVGLNGGSKEVEITAVDQLAIQQAVGSSVAQSV